MPRKARKTMSGANAQPLRPVPDQVYGKGQELLQMQRAMPMPQGAPSPAPASGPPAARTAAGGPAGPSQQSRPTPPPAAPAAAPRGAVSGATPAAAPQRRASPQDFQALLAQAASIKDQTGLLTAPTLRDNEPVTAGLQRGPGPGVEALAAPAGSPAGEMLRRLSAATGDSKWAELAAKART